MGFMDKFRKKKKRYTAILALLTALSTSVEANVQVPSELGATVQEATANYESASKELETFRAELIELRNNYIRNSGEIPQNPQGLSVPDAERLFNSLTEILSQMINKTENYATGSCDTKFNNTLALIRNLESSSNREKFNTTLEEARIKYEEFETQAQQMQSQVYALKRNCRSFKERTKTLTTKLNEEHQLKKDTETAAGFAILHGDDNLYRDYLYDALNLLRSQELLQPISEIISESDQLLSNQQKQ